MASVSTTRWGLSFDTSSLPEETTMSRREIYGGFTGVLVLILIVLMMILRPDFLVFLVSAALCGVFVVIFFFLGAGLVHFCKPSSPDDPGPM
jgi:hypothetical protein